MDKHRELTKKLLIELREKINHYRPSCYLWDVGLREHPVKDGYLDVIYGPCLGGRVHIKLIITEVDAIYSEPFKKWDIRYGAGWQDSGNPLNIFPSHLQQ